MTYIPHTDRIKVEEVIEPYCNLCGTRETAKTKWYRFALYSPIGQNLITLRFCSVHLDWMLAKIGDVLPP